MKKRPKQIYNNISFPAQASDFTLKIFSSMASDKVYDITRLTGCSQNILENMQISASIVLQDNSNKKWKKKGARIYCHFITKKSTRFTFYQL